MCKVQAEEMHRVVEKRKAEQVVEAMHTEVEKKQVEQQAKAHAALIQVEQVVSIRVHPGP